MKFYVLGFVFNSTKDEVLLIQKESPAWQKGKWNGIGGKIEEDESPSQAMERECLEETGMGYLEFEHVLTFTCYPGGTVFVYRAFDYSLAINYEDNQLEHLDAWPVDSLPPNVIGNLRWLIPVCLSNLQMPIQLQQNGLGIDG